MTTTTTISVSVFELEVSYQLASKASAMAGISPPSRMDWAKDYLAQKIEDREARLAIFDHIARRPASEYCLLYEQALDNAWEAMRCVIETRARLGSWLLAAERREEGDDGSEEPTVVLAWDEEPTLVGGLV